MQQRATPMRAIPSALPVRASGGRSLWASGLFIACVAAVAVVVGGLGWAVYALAFWHYLLYALAFRYGAVPLRVFRRDAVLMKGLSLAGLGVVYLSAPIDGLSLIVVGAGFLLNATAATVLGSDRTYYGHELAALAPLRVVRFPYSVLAHPMLVGNMLAFGGTLLNEAFRASWWPLACAHVVANLGLLLMERHVLPLRLAVAAVPRPPRRGTWRGAVACGVAGASIGAAAAVLAAEPTAPWAAALGAAAGLYAHALYIAYTVPAARRGSAPPPDTEDLPCATPPG
ncbi:MAG: phosphatidylethanolamine N-methyltransferase family protein [Xanthomonadaceae bacterium]|jgi:hypothetical protein|nr:phosphatidylethanolamine N-methyltransferase family protein [Xanthomonadaceae bacterium]